MMEGIAQTIAGNTKPIKLAPFVLLLLAPAYYLYTLYSDAESRRVSVNRTNVELLKTVQSLVNELLPPQKDHKSMASPWNDNTTKLLQEAIARLADSQASYTMSVKIFVGRYCRDKYGTVLQGETLLTRCANLNSKQDPKDYFGDDRGHDVLLGYQIASELKSKLMGLFPQIPLDMTVNALDVDKYPYPSPEATTVDDWNKVASLNTRIELEVRQKGMLTGFLGYPQPPLQLTLE